MVNAERPTKFRSLGVQRRRRRNFEEDQRSRDSLKRWRNRTSNSQVFLPTQTQPVPSCEIFTPIPLLDWSKHPITSSMFQAREPVVDYNAPPTYAIEKDCD